MASLFPLRFSWTFWSHKRTPPNGVSASSSFPSLYLLFLVFSTSLMEDGSGNFRPYSSGLRCSSSAKWEDSGSSTHVSSQCWISSPFCWRITDPHHRTSVRPTAWWVFWIYIYCEVMTRVSSVKILLLYRQKRKKNFSLWGLLSGQLPCNTSVLAVVLAYSGSPYLSQQRPCVGNIEPWMWSSSCLPAT